MPYPSLSLRPRIMMRFLLFFMGEKGGKRRERKKKDCMSAAVQVIRRVFPRTNEVSLSLRCCSGPPFTCLAVSLTCMEDLSHTLTLHTREKKLVVMRQCAHRPTHATSLSLTHHFSAVGIPLPCLNLPAAPSPSYRNPTPESQTEVEGLAEKQKG